MMKKDQRDGAPETPSPGTDKEREQQFVTLSLRALRSGAAHLPPAVRHDKGDRHRWPFVPVWRRLLAVPQNDDLGATRPPDSLGLVLVHFAKSNLIFSSFFFFYLRAVF